MKLLLALSLLSAAPALAETVATKPPAVTVAVAGRDTIVETVDVTGTLVARDEVLVNPQIDGLPSRRGPRWRSA